MRGGENVGKVAMVVVMVVGGRVEGHEVSALSHPQVQGQSGFMRQSGECTVHGQ